MKKTMVSIYEDIKPNINNDSKPNINNDTMIEMFSIIENCVYGYNSWEKRQIIWIFWKSHVSELCEKWIRRDGNYAYTRFEEFCACSGEVRFTNEHKAVVSENDVRSYMDV